VNRDPSRDRTVGRALSFDPANDYGPACPDQDCKDPLGDETLELAADDCLDASAGYLPLPPDGERWETSSRVRIRRAYLGHIALVPEPADEGARVPEVRGGGRLAHTWFMCPSRPTSF
jgi:hypothetical protein